MIYKPTYPLGIFLHNYNSETKSYGIIDFHRINCIFSEILFSENLKERALTMTIYSYLPRLDANFDITGCYDPQTLIGPDALILKAIAKKCNFTWQILAVKRPSVPNPFQKPFTKVNEKCQSDASLWPLLNSKADVIGNFNPIPNVAEGEISLKIENLKNAHIRLADPLVAVVPILHKSTDPTRDFLILLSATITITIFRIAVKLIRFNNKEFRRNARPKKEKIRERIVLGCLLMVSVIYSADIIDALFNSIMLHENQIITLDWEKLSEFQITVMSYVDYITVLRSSENPLIKNLARKSISSTCLMPQSQAENIVRLSSRIHGKPNICKDYVIMQWLMITLRPIVAAVYAEKFEEVAQKLTEAGLIEKWYKTEYINIPYVPVLNNKSNSCFIGEARKYTSLPLFTITCAGYILSILVFIGEILVHRAHDIRSPNY